MQKERQGGFDSMLADLEKRHGGTKRPAGKAKAAGGSKSKGRKAADPNDDPLDDAAFEAAQQRMMAGRNR